MQDKMVLIKRLKQYTTEAATSINNYKNNNNNITGT